MPGITFFRIIRGFVGNILTKSHKGRLRQGAKKELSSQSEQNRENL